MELRDDVYDMGLKGPSIHHPILLLGRALQRNGTNRSYIYIWKESLILRNWFLQLWRLASLKFARQAGNLETQVRVNIHLESEFHKRAVWKVFYVAAWRKIVAFN